MAEKSPSPSESVPALDDAPEAPPRPDVMLAVLHESSLELLVAHAGDGCDFEILNISANPSLTWEAAVKVEPTEGANWRQTDPTLGRLILYADALSKLAVRADQAMLIRQVKPDGRPSIQSLFRVIVAI